MNLQRVFRFRVCSRRILLALLSVLSVCGITPFEAGTAHGAGPSFDQEIAPLLARRCLSCHDGSARKGELDLSRAATAAKGGESGPAVVSGQLAKSALWARVSADEMPPKQPLSADEKSLLKAWIEAGATWGVDPIDPFRYSSEQRAGYDWWSLQPVRSPKPPGVRQGDWVINDVDRFVLKTLEEHGLQPAGNAAPRALIRRLYFDLTGLPPTAREMSDWIGRLSGGSAEQREAAYRQLVDHLLDSPHHGERWARHWLDVVRFGESQGYERNRIRDNAWRYRDWVIEAFNADLPYDEFIRRQVAGDVLYPEDLSALLATGYHVCGTWDQVGHNEGSAIMRVSARQDHLEDLVATLGQSFLGLTVQCARCHDHKFDPLSQRDYYRIAAALGGVNQQEKEREGIRLRPPGDPYGKWQAEVAVRREELQQFEQSLRKTSGSHGSPPPLAGLQALYTIDGASRVLKDQSRGNRPLDLKSGGKPRWSSDGPASGLIAAAKASGELTVEVWLTPGRDLQSGPARIVTLSQDSGQRNFTLGHDGRHIDVRLRTTTTDGNGLPSLAGPEVLTAGQRTHVVFTFARDGHVRLYGDGRQVAEASRGGDLSNWNDSFRLGLGDELNGDRRWDGEIHFVALYGRALTAEQVSRNFASESRNVRGEEPLAEVLEKATPGDRERHAKLEAGLHELERQAPARPFEGVAHVIIPWQPEVFHVLQRGDFRSPGAVVSPGGIQVLDRVGLPADFGLKPDAPEAERRKELAAWITDVRNPLTARVFVNRVWHYHFGTGIVDTPSDLGFSGGRPSHPELLDWLARRFVDSGWKIKDLHRLIVLSATYRQSANVRNPRAEEIDADNRLLWRAKSRRLEGEELRDAMLAVSGALNPQIGGPSYRDVAVKLATNHEFTDPTGEFGDAVNRRTIYRLWARAGNNPLLEALDCPDPSVAIARRPQTITPVQSLALINGRFTEHCAARFAERCRQSAGEDVDRQVTEVWSAAFGRAPAADEHTSAAEFVRRRGLAELCLVLFNTNEFCFVE